MRGMEVLRFARSEMSEGAAKADAMASWSGTPGVAARALSDLLDLRANDTDADAAEKRAAMLSRLLSLRPLSAAEWLSLAGLRIATARPNGEVLAALRLSGVTGPDEGKLMWQRGALGLLQWERLPPGDRTRTMADLAGPLADGLSGGA